MPQTLYRFGIDPSDPSAKATIPTTIVTNARIEVLWSAWCDLIHTTLNGDGTRSINYLGTSLNSSQQLDVSQSLLSSGYPLQFFGTAMHDGVRGHIANSKVTIYGTPAEKVTLGDHYRDVAVWSSPYHLHQSISMCGDGSLLVSASHEQRPKPGSEDTISEPHSITSLVKEHPSNAHHGQETKHPKPQTISYVASLRELQDQYSRTDPAKSVASFAPTQLVVNATTATALDQEGRVYTRTTDPRYPTCLGRAHTGTSTFEPVPYLSETRITKIASGGYMTAAVSAEGELFLWGQANPGTKGELGVLHRLDYASDVEEARQTTIQSDAMTDDDVRCLVIYIQGKEARAYDVAVGFGHILVAARDDSGNRVVFGAGCGSEGQLGVGSLPDFCEEFCELEALRNKEVIQMKASGWTSLVVIGE
jgi:hypothetical protein